MRRAVGRPNLHRLGFTAASCLTSESHNNFASFRRPARASRDIVGVPSGLISSRSQPVLTKLLLLLLCFFIQHGAATALVGRTESLPSTQTSVLPSFSMEARATSGHGPAWPLSHDRLDLRKRQDQSSTLASAPAESSQSSLPYPFDGGVGNNFTTPSCPLFFQTFLEDPGFQACHAVSLLLVTSQSFFESSRSANAVNNLLHASCSANVDNCKSMMDNYARGLTAKGACKEDFDAENPNVLEAYQGFLAYESVYNATCEKSPKTKDYCFTNALTDITNPTSSYIYYLPLSLPLPAGTQPSCNDCLELTMNNYAQFAGNGSLPISSVYSGAVQAVDQACGMNYVTSPIPQVVGLAGRTRLSTPLLTLLTVAATVLLW